MKLESKLEFGRNAPKFQLGALTLSFRAPGRSFGGGQFGMKLEGLAEGLQRKWSTVCLKGIAERYAVATGLDYLLLCSSVPREQAGS